MGNTETIEIGGFTMRAQELEEGRWVGEILDRAVPQLTSTSLANLKEQFRSVTAALAENEAALEGQSLDTRQDAMLHHLHSYPLENVSAAGDEDYRPAEPGEQVSRERWED